MGFERNAAGLFLKMHADGHKLGRVLTLGHQDVHLDLHDYNRVLRRLGQAPVGTLPAYANDLLLAMGASSVDSMDASGYEQASLTHDLNRAIPEAWNERYDLVFDGGTLEHVFNFPQAIGNCMRMVAPGGRFVSVTIPNNWCGHGFYQFSPELFYRVFSADNGYTVQEMYLAELGGKAYAVKDPAALGARVELCGARPVYLLVHARRDAVREIFASTPQQSDYVVHWGNEPVGGAKVAGAWKAYPGIRQLRRYLRARRAMRQRSLDNRAMFTPADLSF